MALKSAFCVVVLAILLLSTEAAAEGGGNKKGFNLGMASKALSDKGYQAMSMTFDMFFKTQSVSEWLMIMNNNNSRVLTVFCPPDHAFFSSSFKYPQPPLRLLEYHAVPLKLDIEALKSLPHASKIDTLLLGHPLVVTTLFDSSISLNGVKIKEWNLYSDEGLIVHGVDDFFDPAFQTLMYPKINDFHAQEEEVSVFSLSWWAMKELTDNWILLFAVVVMGLSLLLLSFYSCVDKSTYGDHHFDYECIPHKEKEEESQAAACSLIN